MTATLIDERSAAAAPRRHGRVRGIVLRRPAPGGLVGALVAWWWSIFPSLLPRTWLAQALVGAICITVGYAVGLFLTATVRTLWDDRARPHLDESTRRAVAAAGVVLATGGLVAWLQWQNDQRELVGMAPVGIAMVVPLLVATLVVVAVIGTVGRLAGHVLWLLDGVAVRRFSRPVGHGVVAIVVLLGLPFVSREVVAEGFVAWADDRFGQLETTDTGVAQPTSAGLSGSPESLVAWSTLGYEGRRVVAGATPVEALRAFHGADAEVLAPIRVYVGLQSADTLAERATLAVRELERTGAFDREVLCVTTVIGTGWIDPEAATTLEYLHAGDTAIVGLQYSYLPSWMSFLANRQAPEETARALYEAVHRRWAQLDPATRPRLIVFGESLGSYGAEAAFAGDDVAESIANLTTRADGALLVGPTEANAIHRQLVAARDAGTPSWQPVYDDGETVRFARSAADIRRDAASWEFPRVLYLQHPSDPVAQWTPEMMWRPTAWAETHQATDVPARSRWFPFVTWLQTVADLAMGARVPEGHGHHYDSEYLAAWTAVAPPADWTASDGARLAEAIGPP